MKPSGTHPSQLFESIHKLADTIEILSKRLDSLEKKESKKTQNKKEK